jgi:hypothetical protein
MIDVVAQNMNGQLKWAKEIDVTIDRLTAFYKDGMIGR